MIRSWLATRLRPSRHTLYFEVLEAVRQEGCPLCRLGRRALSWYLDMLSYEGINDPGVRARLRAARGLCNLHAWRFVQELRNAPGRAIIYRDLLGQPLQSLSGRGAALPARLPGLVTRRLAGFGAAGNGGDALAGELLPSAECPACQSLGHATRRYLETLLLHLGDGELRARYQASGGLCLPHLDLALAQVRRPHDRQLLLEVAARWAGSLGVASRSGLREQTLAIVAGVAGRPDALRPGPPPQAGGDPAPAGMPLPPRLPTAEPPAPGDGCPVCREAVREVDAYLGFLPSVSSARGGGPAFGLQLCAVHAWRSLELLPPGAAARLWQPVARAARSALGGEGRLEPSRSCLACRYQATVERRATWALLQSLEGNDSAGASGLCLPHLALGLELSPSAPVRAGLISAQVRALQRLRAELDEYIRKQDYDCRERPGPEADSPWRAMSRVAGMEGLGAGTLAWTPRARGGRAR